MNFHWIISMHMLRIKHPLHILYVVLDCMVCYICANSKLCIFLHDCIFFDFVNIKSYVYICLSIDQRWYQWWCSPPNKDQDIKKNVIYLEGITIWPFAFNHPMISIYQVLPSTILSNYPIAPKHENCTSYKTMQIL